MVVEFFRGGCRWLLVVLGGCWSFLVLVTTSPMKVRAECTTKLPAKVVYFSSHQEYNLIAFLKTQNYF